MNKNFVQAVGVIAALVSSGVHAAPPQSFVGIHYIDVSYDEDGLEADGDGFGVGAKFALARGAFIPVEYSSITLDDVEGFSVDIDIDELRVGAGFSFKASPSATVNLAAKYIDIDFGGDATGGANGLGIFAGLSGNITPPLAVYADLGYLLLESDEGGDVDGVDISVGASFDLGGPGLYAEYRMTRYDEDDIGVETDVDQIRVGARFSF